MNKKWLIAIYTMLSVFVVGVVTTVIVLASGTHYVGSNISVIYTASGIGGKVTATYQVGSNTAVAMVGSKGETVIEFGSEEPETVALLSPSGTIVPGYKEDIILTYTFINEGPLFYATVTYTDTSSESPKDNIAITYKGESDTDYNKKSTVVTVPQLETVSYSIKLSINKPYMDANMDGTIKWALTQEEPIIEDSVDELVILNIANNGDSSVTSDALSFDTRTTSDGTKQFKIVGAVPESAVSTTTSSGYVNGSYSNRSSVVDSSKGTMTVAELTNSSGAEFYYFCKNPEVVGTTSYVDPGSKSIYYTSTSDSTLERWYKVPSDTLQLYSCFMTPTYTSSGWVGDNTDLIISNEITSLPANSFSGKNITALCFPRSLRTICTDAFTGCNAYCSKQSGWYTSPNVTIEQDAFSSFLVYEGLAILYIDDDIVGNGYISSAPRKDVGFVVVPVGVKIEYYIPEKGTVQWPGGSGSSKTILPASGY